MALNKKNKRIGNKRKAQDNPFLESQKIASQFDDATLKQDVDKLRELILSIEKDLDDKDIFFKAQMYYSLATATDTVSRLSDNDVEKREDSIKKQLYYYRESLKIIKTEEFNVPKYMAHTRSLQACLLTNYGNTLRECGRVISAIEQYKNALGYYPFFPMAMGNLGCCYMQYAYLLGYNQEFYRDCLNRHSYLLLNDALESKDPNIYIEGKAYFASQLSRFHIDYREFLSNPIAYDELKIKTKKENEYRQWVLDNNLFLSPLNDLIDKNISFAKDTIGINRMLTSAEETMPVAFGMFNQLKQEYISARFLLYESIAVNGKVHFSDFNTNLTETLEYAQFSLRVEKLKIAFKTIYGILDKIAYFLNVYYDLGIPERSVNYRSVWRDETNGKKHKNVLNIDENFALASLYWICQDFDETFGKDSNPGLKRLRKIRNFLEHKYTIVTWFYNDKKPLKEHVEALYISENELYECTIELFKVVREAVICLALCVNVEEDKKIDKLSDETKVVNMTISKFDDEFKF